MPLVEKTSIEDLYRLLKALGADTDALRKKGTSYNKLATLYLKLLDERLSQSARSGSHSSILD